MNLIYFVIEKECLKKYSFYYVERNHKMLKLLKNLGKKEWLFMFLAIVFIIIQVWLDLKLPDYMSEITILVQTEGSLMKF